MLEGFIEGLISFNWLFGLFMSLASCMVIRMITVDEYKNEVSQIVNAEIYRRIMVEYRKMGRERGFGLLAVITGLIVFSIEYSSLLTQLPEINILLFIRNLIAPVLITFAGYLCYQKAFMKAMAMAIREMNKVFSGEIYQSSK